MIAIGPWTAETWISNYPLVNGGQFVPSVSGIQLAIRPHLGQSCELSLITLGPGTYILSHWPSYCQMQITDADRDEIGAHKHKPAATREARADLFWAVLTPSCTSYMRGTQAPGARLGDGPMY